MEIFFYFQIFVNFFNKLISLQKVKIYTASYLRIILRCNPSSFSEWAISLIISLLHDESRTVASQALDVIDEACDNTVSIISNILIPVFNESKLLETS